VSPSSKLTEGELGMPHELKTANSNLAIQGIGISVPGICLASKLPLAYDAL
jgi:hypothetical protein